MTAFRLKKRTLLAEVITALLVAGIAMPAAAIEYTTTHVFSLKDIQGGFNGTTFGGVAGSVLDTSILCGAPGSSMPVCPPNANQPFVETKGSLLGVQMFPIDSEFGFYVQDYVGAAPKARDSDYAEGWGGYVLPANVPPGEDPGDYPLGTEGQIGIALADVPTDTYKVTPPWGRWCVGAGGNSVKCETEHYVTMENIITCYETIPYFYADPTPGAPGDAAATRAAAQADLYDPHDYDWTNPLDPYATATPIGTCEIGQLNNLPYMVVDGVVTETPLAAAPDGTPDMPANESNARNNIAVTSAYAITKKDDGKALYRFGNQDKRPNDIRFYARMALPAEWKANPGVAYPVTKAKLRIRQLITNNPNDQVRPEDMENEGAIGRLPQYVPGSDGQWLTAKPCYEGDGDFIDTGTVLRNPYFAYNKDALPSDLRDYLTADIHDDVNGVPYPFSADLVVGNTAAWYTSTDREPFEWAYDTNIPNDGIVNVSTPIEAIPGVTPGVPVGSKQLSGPRWRLRPNKFGQDLPGLEIPSIECLPVPYTSEFIKYPVLQPDVIEIDLLDFADVNKNGIKDDSPLWTSQGWIKPNGVNVPSTTYPGMSENGAPLTDDFDLTLYIKGDQKSVAVYNATLEISYDTAVTPVAFDASLDSIAAPGTVTVGDTETVGVNVTNAGPAVAEGSVQITGYYNRRGTAPTVCDPVSIDGLASGASQLFNTNCVITSPTSATLVRWGAVLTAPNDTNAANNTITTAAGYSSIVAQPAP